MAKMGNSLNFQKVQQGTTSQKFRVKETKKNINFSFHQPLVFPFRIVKQPIDVQPKVKGKSSTNKTYVGSSHLIVPIAVQT